MSHQVTLSALHTLFTRDLNRLKEEVSQYTDATDLWKTADGISNSGGNLALHICGNLQHFVGAVLGNTGYVRQRDQEFSSRVSLESLLSEIDTTIATVQQTLLQSPAIDLAATYPPGFYREPMQNGIFLLHLYAHLSYHTGQINYHRRLLS